MSYLCYTFAPVTLILQTIALSSLLIIGISFFDFGISTIQIIVLITSALLFQIAFCILFGQNITLNSALISALSLCLLLRTNSIIYIPILASFLTISSKFLIRINGAHVFNPTNFGLTICLIFNLGWLDVGQWGHKLFFGYFFVFSGLIVVQKAQRIGVLTGFISTYILISIARAFWLGDKIEIPLHNLQSGSLLLFAFFMITDPKTTPKRFLNQFIFGFFVAALSTLMRFKLYTSYAPIYALFVISSIYFIYNIVVPKLYRDKLKIYTANT